MAFTASESKATPLGDPSTTPCILAYLKPHAIHTGRQLSSPLVGHYQHFIGIDLESQRELPQDPLNSPSPLVNLQRPLGFMPSRHSSPSASRLPPPCHLQEHPERIQLGGLHHPPEAHPTVAVRSPPSPSAPAHRAGSSPDPSSPSGPLRSGETKAAVSQSGSGGPSQPYPRRLQSSPGNFLAHTPPPPPVPMPGPGFLGFSCSPPGGTHLQA